MKTHTETETAEHKATEKAAWEKYEAVLKVAWEVAWEKYEAIRKGARS